ncbi:hypothetical protein, partial [Ornithobacterium rhinotracheale]
TSRQTKNLNKLLIRILLHLQVEFSYYQLMKEKKSAQIEFLKDFSEKDIDFMLRFYKPTRYGN